MESVPDGNETFWNRVRLRQTIGDVALLFAIVGLIALLAAAGSVVRAQMSATWPTAPGVIVSSGLETMPLAGRMIRYEPVVVIEYRYEVAGTLYTSTTVSQGVPPVRADTAEAERLLTTYPVDATVTVRYFPDDPSQAVLEQAPPDGMTTLLLVLFAIGAVFGVVALLLRSGEK